MKPFVHRFTVEGTGSFPFDMLRYEAAWPHSSTDSVLLNRNHREERCVELECSNHRKWEPTISRWKSFGWRVIEHKVF